MEDENDLVPSTDQENPAVNDGNAENQPGDQSSNNTDANPNPTEQPSGSEKEAKSAPAETLEDIVSKALKPGKEATSPSELKKPIDPKSKGKQADPKAAVDPKAKKDGEGQDDIPQEFHKHPAWQRLKKERDEARAETDQYREDSQEYQVITGFMQEHQISAPEVAETLQWLALKNSDPIKFGEMIVDLAAQFQEGMGYVLSPELQARVDAGEITEEDAKKLSTSEAKARLLENRKKQTDEQTAEGRKREASVQLSKQMADTVNSWEKQVRLRDPDYAAKRDAVQDAIRALIQKQGWPKDAKGALEYAQVAYEVVTKRYASVLPKRKPNDPAPQGGKSVETDFVPKSLEDVVSHALSGGS